MELKLKEVMKKKLPEHKDERGKRERIAMKALAGFIIIMLVLTMLSRLADSITIPTVGVANPKSGRVEHTFEWTGQLEAQNEVEIEAEAGLNVKEIFVESGDQVAKGDPLLKLDVKELEEKIESIKVEIEKMYLQKKQMQLNGGSENAGDLIEEATLALERLKEDKELLDEQEAVKIERIEASLVEAELALEEAEKNYETAKKKQEDLNEKNLADQMTEIQEEIEEAKKNVEKQKYEQEKALKRAQKVVDEAEAQLWLLDGGDATMALERIESARMEYEITKKDWQRNVKEAEDALKKVEDKLLKLEQGEVDEDTLQAEKNKIDVAKDKVKAKQSEIEDAVYSKDQALAKMDREMIDAERKITEAEKQTEKNNKNEAKDQEKNNISLELLQLDIEVKEKELSRLVGIKANNSTIIAPVDGTIDVINVKKGEKTASTTLITVISADTNYVFEAEIDQESAEKIAVGDQVSITLEGEKRPIEEDTVIERIVSVKGDENNKGNKKKVIVNLTQGTAGVSGKLVVRKESDKYPSIVPIEAIREDNQGKYVLVVSKQVTTLGEQYITQRIGITEFDRNGKVVGVQGGLSPQDQIITEANKPIAVGDRVRLGKQ
ncbi:MAG: biotin/lipoyl-binding protein [Cellulosilyticaceae bacterium]